jgi:hypothetical protein
MTLDPVKSCRRRTVDGTSEGWLLDDNVYGALFPGVEPRRNHDHKVRGPIYGHEQAT